jgi:hypothetical protein
LEASDQNCPTSGVVGERETTVFCTSVFMYTREHNVQHVLSVISYLGFTAARFQDDKHPEHVRHTKILTI